MSASERSGFIGALWVGPIIPAMTSLVPLIAGCALRCQHCDQQSQRQIRNSDGRKSETFIDTLRRVGPDAFKAAANGARFAADKQPAQAQPA